MLDIVHELKFNFQSKIKSTCAKNQAHPFDITPNYFKKVRKFIQLEAMTIWISTAKLRKMKIKNKFKQVFKLNNGNGKQVPSAPVRPVNAKGECLALSVKAKTKGQSKAPVKYVAKNCNLAYSIICEMKKLNIKNCKNGKNPTGQKSGTGY